MFTIIAIDLQMIQCFLTVLSEYIQTSENSNFSSHKNNFNCDRRCEFLLKGQPKMFIYILLHLHNIWIENQLDITQHQSFVDCELSENRVV